MLDKIVEDKEYLYLSAQISARETNMLSRDKMERMLSAVGFSDAAKAIIECGYEDMSAMTAKQVEDALANHRASVFNDLAQRVPESAVVNAFRIKYDYHNAKVVVKAQGTGTDGAHMFSGSGRVTAEAISGALISEDYRFLPLSLAKATAEAAGILARTGNPQLADFTLDRAYFAELIELAESVNCGFLKEYARFLIDSANLRAGIRTLRLGRDMEFLKLALVSGGTINPERIALASTSVDSLSALFNSTPLERAAALGAAAVLGGSMTEFELACDNASMKFMFDAKLKGFSAERVIAYLVGLESEITAIRMILTGKLSGIEPELIRERLRDSYV